MIKISLKAEELFRLAEFLEAFDIKSLNNKQEYIHFINAANKIIKTKNEFLKTAIQVERNLTKHNTGKGSNNDLEKQ